MLETGRLVLRKFTIDDIERYMEKFNTEDVQRYLGGVLILKNKKDADNWLKNINDRLLKKKIVFTWLIVKKEKDDESAGRIDLGGFLNKKCAELAYYIWDEYWGNGYCREAIERVISFGFDDLELERIQAVIDVRNIKVIEKAGFVREGRLRKYPIGKTVSDVFIYSRIKDDLN